MDKYHIGIRIRGFAKSFLKEKSYFFYQNIKEKYIPHITLLRPFTTNDESELIKKFNQTCVNQKELIHFQIGNFEIFKTPKKIIYAEIKKNPPLKRFINSLEISLDPIIKYNQKQIVSPEHSKRILHVTIKDKEEKLCEKLEELKDVQIDQYLLRTYILKNKLILREYDFALEKILTRDEAKSEEIFKETIKIFKQKTGLKSSKKGFIPI